MFKQPLTFISNFSVLNFSSVDSVLKIFTFLQFLKLKRKMEAGLEEILKFAIRNNAEFEKVKKLFEEADILAILEALEFSDDELKQLEMKPGQIKRFKLKARGPTTTPTVNATVSGPSTSTAEQNQRNYSAPLDLDSVFSADNKKRNLKTKIQQLDNNRQDLYEIVREMTKIVVEDLLVEWQKINKNEDKSVYPPNDMKKFAAISIARSFPQLIHALNFDNDVEVANFFFHYDDSTRKQGGMIHNILGNKQKMALKHSRHDVTEENQRPIKKRKLPNNARQRGSVDIENIPIDVFHFNQFLNFILNYFTLSFS